MLSYEKHRTWNKLGVWLFAATLIAEVLFAVALVILRG
jgi:hypothetical protein